MKKYQFDHMVAAGSWDHFHIGHRRFIDEAFRRAQRVSVGITSDEMIAKKDFARALESFTVRKRSLRDYLVEKGYLARAKIVKLIDIYGPALTDNTMDSLLVTKNTLNGGRKVNEKRKGLNLIPLQLIKVALEKDRDGKEISSERIRAGEINLQGRVYFDLFNRFGELQLPEQLRPSLQKPFGELLLGEGSGVLKKIKSKLKKLKPIYLICVGDIVTELLVKNDFKADIYIVDFRVERKPRFTSLKELGFASKQKLVRLSNRAGIITKELAKQIQDVMVKLSLEKPAPVILVDGEEDLAVLPAVLAAPLKSVILYGQPKQGVVLVEVSESKKEETHDLLVKFKQRTK